MPLSEGAPYRFRLSLVPVLWRSMIPLYVYSGRHGYIERTSARAFRTKVAPVRSDLRTFTDGSSDLRILDEVLILELYRLGMSI